MKKSNSVLLSVLIPVALVAVALFCMLFYQRNMLEINERRTNLALRETAAQQAATFEATLDGQYSILYAFSGALMSQEEHGWENISGRMMGVLENTHFLHLFLVDADGLAHGEDGRTVNVAERRYFTEAMAGRTAIQRVESGLLEHEPRLILSVPLLKDGVPVGVLYGSYDEQRFRDLLIPGSSARGGYSFVCDNAGNIIIGSDTGEQLLEGNNFLTAVSELKFSDSSPQELANSLLRLHSGVAEFFIGEERQYAVYQPLGLYDWVIFNVLPGSVIDTETEEMSLRGSAMSLIVLAAALLCMVTLIYAFRRQAHQLSELARRDMMTGLLNHDTVLADIKEYLAGNGDQPHALFMVDMDNFKSVNDLLGHQAGDRLICKTARDLQTLFDPQDILGRVGGDEYAILWKLPGGREALAEKVAQLCEKLRYAYRADDMPVHVSCSVGVSLSAPGKSVDQLYREADIALYRAKNSGKDRYCVMAD